MNRRLLLTLLLATSLAAQASAQQTLSADQLAHVTFEQRLGATIPLNLTFRDESGAPVRLGNFFGQRPVILVLAYYDCPYLCTVVLNGLLESVRNLRLEAGRDFEIVVISINPSESPSLADAKKHMYSTRYGRPGTARGWHFLTGDAQPIRDIAESVGFHYVYDPASKQYAHPSGITVLTPAGKVSRYFLGIEYPPKDLQLTLVEASRNKIGTLADRLLLLCFHYNPVTGRYSLLITRVLQVAGIGTALLLGTGIVCLIRRERSRNAEGSA